MRIDPIGRVEDPQNADIEPIIIPICGLSNQTRDNVCEEFKFRPTLPWGNTFALIEQAESGETIMAANTVKWLRNCLVGKDEQERFRQFLLRDDVEIEQATIEAVYKALADAYSGRPTLPRTSSTGTGGGTEQTSGADSRPEASTSNAAA